MEIVIDTREQTPWAFPPHFATCKRGTLRSGDYALAGDNGFAIERKSLDDFVATVCSRWSVFKRELDRMAEDFFPARVIIIEADLNDIVEGRYNSPRITPQFVFKRIGQLTMMGVSVLFAGTVEAAVGLAYAVLKQRATDLVEMEAGNAS